MGICLAVAFISVKEAVMSKTAITVIFLTLLCSVSFAQEQDSGRLLIGQVTANKTHIAFSYAGDIWIVERNGGQARKLTTDPAEEDFPRFSTDGSRLAFSRVAGGDTDIFVMPSAGGEAKRLTWYPKRDIPLGWTPDGKNILFVSGRDEEGSARLYSIPADGVFPTALPLPQGFNGSYSPDASRIAYTPYEFAFGEWRHYRGGMASKIWLARLADGEIERLPAGDYNDRYPMWLGSSIYFISDRTATFNLFNYDLKTKQSKQLTSFEKYGIRSATATDDAIVFIRDGRIHLFDLKSNAARAIDVQVDADRSELKQKTVSAARWIEAFNLSANGDRILFGARGEALLFDPAKNQSLNLTRTSGAAEREPALSPDGRWVAYFSDESGEYQIHIRASSGEGAVKKITIEQKPSYYRELTWSPDSRKLAFSDKRLSIWYAEAEKGTARRIDTSVYSYQQQYYPSWSPDGRFLAYSKCHANRMRTVYIHDTESAKSYQMTDGVIHAENPVFDRNGKYLYFTSSAMAGASEFGWGVLSGVLARPLVTRMLHAIILQNAAPSPLLVNSQPNADAKVTEAASPFRIDFNGVEQRIITFPVGARDYAALATGRAGIIYAMVTEWPAAPGPGGGQASRVLYRYDISKPRQMEKVAEGLNGFILSDDGSKVLYVRGQSWALVSADAVPKPDEGRLDLRSLEVTIDPRAEWNQIYHEAWRIMRDYFYDPNLHGQNVAELERYYGDFLPRVTRRSDLNALMRAALGHISVSHLGVGGGDAPAPGGTSGRVGLIGADFRIDQGSYQITRVLRSGHYTSSNSLLRAPLDQPGMNVKEGEYVIDIDGQKVTSDRNILSYLEGKAGQTVKVTIGPKPDGTGARTLSVMAVPGEQGLRRENWKQRNREMVEKLSGGKLGYIYVPDYGQGGIEDFFRGVYGYRDNKQGIVIDQRFNGGGITSDFLIELLQREPLYYYMFRDGDDIATPTNPVSMPKVLVINEWNGSAAETFPFMFKLAKVGTIVGKRTSGGGIGPYVSTPGFIDGGRAQIPNRAAYNSSRGTWDVENHGVEPDIDIEVMPKDFLAGRDPQLEKAVEIALKQIQAAKPQVKQRPKYPVHK